MLTNEFLSIAQMTIPETFEECLTYEMQILYLKRYIDEVAEGGIPSADLSDIWDAIHALEDEVEKINPDKIEQEISDLKDKIESLENATVTVGETVTGEPGTNAKVENTGTAQNVVLKFTIPRGEKGEKGEQGERGETGAKGDPGEPGERGPAGERGPQGDIGPEGPKGPQGPEGPEGPRGEQGAQGLPGEKGEKGDPGERGPAGERGEQGPAGEAATVTVGETVTGEPGTPAKVENTGTAQNVILKFTIPKGEKGDPGTGGGGGGSTVSVDVGETVTGDPGTNANVENTGDDQNVVLKFTIPRGEKGETGAKGDKGDPGQEGPQGPAGERGEQGPAGERGEQGPAGENGAPGAKGDPGESATVTVGETVTAEPGTPAKVENTGTPQNAILKFTIPKGEKGDPGTGGGGSGDDLTRYAFSLPGEIDCCLFQFASDLAGVTYHAKTDVSIVGDSSDEKVYVWLPNFETHKPLTSTDYTKFNFLMPVAVAYGVTTGYVLIPAAGYWDFTSATPKMNIQTAPTFFNTTRMEGSDFNLLSEFYITVTPEEVTQ